MYYVEMLRVLRALKVFAIILGVLFFGMAAFRIAMNKQLDANNYLWASPTAVKTERIEKDGSKTTVIDDRAKNTHVEVRQGSGLYRVTITEPKPGARPGRSPKPFRGHARESEFNSAGVSISTRDSVGGRQVTTIERNSNVPLDMLLMVAGFLSAIMATVFGNALSKENDGHLELPWTKPVSREAYALTGMVVDCAGILSAFSIALITMLLMFAVFAGIPHLITSSQTLLTVAVSVLFPLSWYGLMQGMTASLRRASGLILGLSWPVAFALPPIAQIKWSLQPVLQFFDTFNPIAYFSRSASMSDSGVSSTLTLIHNSSLSTDAVNAVMLFMLALLGLSAALLQWRRLEA